MSFLIKYVKFGMVAGGVFLMLGWYFYELYGDKFLQQTYLYHLGRRDNRHSFSPFFYEIYLNLDNQTLVRSLMRILPQFYILGVITQKTYLSAFNKVFLLTYCFVAFNRVITMQYYMWVLGALILVLPESDIWLKKQARKGFSLFLQWLIGISIWVWLSFRLEGKG